MNGEIKKLFGQSLDKVVPYTWTTLNRDEVEKISEVFSQLVVQECISKIEKNFAGAIGTYAGVYNSAVLKCKTSLEDFLK